MANKNAFRDAEELLSGPETFWILFTEDLDNIDRDEVHSQSGLYHWRLDVYCFMAEERVLVVSFGHPNKSEWFVSTDPDLIKLYTTQAAALLPVLREMKSMLEKEKSMIKDSKSGRK